MDSLFRYIAIVAVASTPVGAQVDTVYPPAPVEPYFDLIAYELTPEMEATFSAEDGLVTEFWSVWGSCLNWYGAEIFFDQIEVNCTYNGNVWDPRYFGLKEFPSDRDARLWVRAAWGQRGLYLYIRARDDHFVDLAARQKNADGTPHTDAQARPYNDAVEIFLDKYGTDVLYAAKDILFGEYVYNRETRNMVHIRHQFGSMGVAPTEYTHCRMHGDSLTGQYSMVCDSEFTSEKARAEADSMAVEIISGSEHGLGDTAKVMEWFFPWSTVGSGGGATPPKVTQASKRVAFAFGYNDSDPGEMYPEYFRWVRAADPYKRVAPPKGGPHIPTDGWGDIVLVHPGCLCGPYAQVDRVPPTPSRAGVSARSQYFTLQGRRLSGMRASRSAHDRHRSQWSVILSGPAEAEGTDPVTRMLVPKARE